MSQTVVTLNGETRTLVNPGSPSLAMQLLRLAEISPEATLGAALLACYPPLSGPAKAVLDRARLLDVGAQVYDWLVVSRGMTPDAVRDAGMTAYRLILSILPRDEEVQEAVGNSETTPSST